MAALLESQVLTRASNSVPINFLLHEGKGRLAAGDRQQVLDQLTAALRLQTSPLVAMMSGMSAAMNTPTQ